MLLILVGCMGNSCLQLNNYKAMIRWTFFFFLANDGHVAVDLLNGVLKKKKFLLLHLSYLWSSGIVDSFNIWHA